MIQLLFNIIIVALILFFYLKSKCTIGVMIFHSLFVPKITIGSLNLNFLFLSVPVFLIAILVKERGDIISLNKFSLLKKYCLLIVYVYVVYFLSWCLFNRNDLYSVFQATFGAIKNLLLLIAICLMNRRFDKKTISKHVFYSIFFISLANLLASFAQLSSLETGKALVSFRNDPLSNSFLLEVVKYGSFARCFGIMSYPMMLGIFSVFSLVVFAWFSKENKVIRIFGFAISIICGACSASKSFWFGALLLLLLYSVLSFHFKKKILRSIIIAFVSLLIVALAFALHDEIGVIIEKTLGRNYAWYWDFLTNFDELFATRYSSEATVLGFMPEFLETYWFMGIGPSSAFGENAIDSAFYIILHHGGVVALIPVLLFFAWMLMLAWKKRDVISFGFIFCMIITAFGFQTLICQDITIWALAFVFVFHQKTNSEVASTTLLYNNSHKSLAIEK